MRSLTAESDHRRDHRDIPDDRRGVGEEELAVAIQNAQPPRGEHQQSGAGEENAHQPDGQFALGALEPGSDDPDQVRRQQDADQHDHRRGQRQDRAHRAGHAARLLLVALGQQARVHRNEGGREHAFAEQILQEIGDAKGRVEGVGLIELAEVVREDALPHQAHDAADQNPRGDQKSVAAGALRFHFGH